MMMSCIRKGILVVLILMGIASLVLENYLLGFSSTGNSMSRTNYRYYWMQPSMMDNNNNIAIDGISNNKGIRCNSSNTTSTTTTIRDVPKDSVARSLFSGLAIVGAFNHKRDVFKDSKGPVDPTFQYIQSWYESLQQFPSMQGIVLHNMFTPEQAKAWTTHQIHFVHVSNHTSLAFQQASQRPINDMRFFVLKDFLTKLYDFHAQEEERDDDDDDEPNAAPSLTTSTFRIPVLSLPDYVLFSDSYDVRFLRNPFEYMQQMDSTIMMKNSDNGDEQRRRHSHPHQLYVGEEYQTRKTIYDRFMNTRSRKCFGKALPPMSRMINCGLIGGHVDVVLELLDRLVSTLETVKQRPPKEQQQQQQQQEQQVCDQISLVYTLSNHYHDQFISGYPFNAQYFQWESANDTLAYIAHK